MSTPKIYSAVISAIKCHLLPATPLTGELRHLDIGAGCGDLIKELRGEFPVHSTACDFHVERFPLKDVVCTKINLNHEPLPYRNGDFDVVTCSEVVEHVENYRALLREAFRVLKPGGVLVVTTPNVLNANSRVRNLISGFANLFGPLPVRNDKLYSTGGHITPIPYFYLAHAFLDTGFDGVELSIDKVQRTSVFWTVLLAPVTLLGWLRFFSRENNKFKTITEENELHVKRHHSWRAFVGRTIVVSATKPAN